MYYSLILAINLLKLSKYTQNHQLILYKSLGKKSNDPRAITLLKEASLIKMPRTKKANSIFIILEN